MFLRHGITDVAPTGQIWIQVHPPNSIGLKNISGGDESVWALDHHGKVWYRQEINPVFPEGTSWAAVLNVSSSPNAFTGGDVKSISARGVDLWAVLGMISKMMSKLTIFGLKYSNKNFINFINEFDIFHKNKINGLLGISVQIWN